MNLIRPFGHPAAACLAAIFAIFPGAVAAQPHRQLVSGAPFAVGDAANGQSLLGDASPDGRFVAITSSANNFHGADVDINAQDDVYLLDRASGEWQLASHRFGNANWSADGGSTAKAVSPDGRFVLFDSYATDLLATPQPLRGQVYLYDRSSGTTALISHPPGQPEVGSAQGAEAAAVSADGRYVLFGSSSPDLIAGTGSAFRALYLHDRATATNRLVSHASSSPTTYGNDISLPVELSQDGRFVLFHSEATDLVAGTTDSASTVDAFLYDRDSGANMLISRPPVHGHLAVGGIARDLSPDGRHILFSSAASSIAGIDHNGSSDCFWYDRISGGPVLVSHAAGFTDAAANGESQCIGMSDDGAWIYLVSAARNLVSGFADGNLQAETDLYLYDRSTADLTLVSHDVAAPNAGGNGESIGLFPVGSVSPDGRHLLYKTKATDLEMGVADTNAIADLYLYDRNDNSSTLASRRGSSAFAAGAQNYSIQSRLYGSSALFESVERLREDPKADANNRSDVYEFVLADSEAGVVSAASTAGRRALGAPTSGFGDHGRWAFAGGWLYDLVTGELELVGHAASSPQLPVHLPVAIEAIDSASRFVLLTSEDTNLAAGITDTGWPATQDVFIYDRTSKAASLVSHAAGAPTVAANASTYALWLSADGQQAIVQSSASNLVPGGIPNPESNLYFYDRPSDQMTLLSHHHGSPNQQADQFSDFYGISSDERFVLIASAATNLVPGFVGNGGSHLYLYDRQTAQFTLISHQAGSPNVSGDGSCEWPVPSGDFRYVYYLSTSRDLVLGPNLPPGNIFYRWDRLTGANLVVKALPVSQWATALPDISLDGRYLLISTSVGLVPGDSNGTLDVYVYDRIADQWDLISHLPGNPAAAKGNSWAYALSDDGRRVTYTGLGFPDRPATTYDRQTREEIDLRMPAFDDGELLATNQLDASHDGNLILVGIDSPRAAPFDANLEPEVFLIELSRLFADGFESGNTAAWSLAVP